MEVVNLQADVGEIIWLEVARTVTPPTERIGKTIRMAESVQQFLDGLVAGIERFAKRIEIIASSFFEGLLKFIEKAYNWIVDVTVRIKNYLARFSKAMGRLLWALFKLSLLYSPGIVLLFLGGGWIALGLIWFLLVTAIGLTYRNK